MSQTFPLAYHVMFLYLEPIFALAGAYNAYFNPIDYLSILCPTSSPPFTKVTQMLLTQIASGYLHFVVIEAVLLRQFIDNHKVWNTVIWGMFLSDIGFTWSLIQARLATDESLEFLWNISQWGSAEWQAWPATYGPLAFRIAFLLGIGFRNKGP